MTRPLLWCSRVILWKGLDARVEIARAQPDASAIECRVGTTANDATTVGTECDPVTVAPYTGKDVKVRGPIAIAGRVVPEAHWH